MSELNHPIGLIGLGHIGMALSCRLIASSRSVIGYRRGACDDFRTQGGMPATSVQALARHCDTIILALPDAAASELVLGQIIESDTSPRTIVNITSMPSHAAITLAQLVRQAGHSYLEAPISGTPDVVRNHKATLFVGGDVATFERTRSLLELLAARVMRVGPIGAGSAVKSAALMVMVINTLGVAEAIAYAESFGVAPAVTFDALKEGPANSGALQHRGPLMVRRDYRPILGQLKDFGSLASAIARSATTPVGMLEQVIKYLDRSVEAGLGGLDVAAVYDVLRSHDDIHRPH